MPAAMAFPLAPEVSAVSVTAVSAGAAASFPAARTGRVRAASSRASRAGISSFFMVFIGDSSVLSIFVRMVPARQAAAFPAFLPFLAFGGTGSETSP